MSPLPHLINSALLQRCTACGARFVGRRLRFVEDGKSCYLAHCPECRAVLIRSDKKPPKERIDKAPDLFPDSVREKGEGA